LNIFVTSLFYGEELLDPKAGGQPLVGCPRLLIQYLCSCPSYLETVYSLPQPEDVPCHDDCLLSCLLSKNVKTRLYNTIILPVVLYGCEAWSLILGGNIENSVLGGLFGMKREEMMEGLRKLHNGELHNSYSWQSIIRMIK
jgi:hypothetical protein